MLKLVFLFARNPERNKNALHCDAVENDLLFLPPVF